MNQTFRRHHVLLIGFALSALCACTSPTGAQEKTPLSPVSTSPSGAQAKTPADIVPAAATAAQEKTPTFLNAQANIEERVNDLLARMTLEEKIAQLQCTTTKIEWGKNITANGLGGVGPLLRTSTAAAAAAKANDIQKLALERTRLRIPILIHDEALHGLMANKATSFPQAIGLAATWNPDLMFTIGTVIGREARSRGIRQVLSPVVNIARDVRWGRVGETYGEDPLLQSRMGVAFCKSVEQEGVITTPKHFVANFGDGGRDSYPVHISERELREVYLPPFEACIREAGAGSVMAAYNALNDIPCSASRWLLTDLLRKEWGFRGIVVSDYYSVEWMRDKHFIASTVAEAGVLAVKAGLDMELPGVNCYGRPLLDTARADPAVAAAVEAAARNVLRTKFRLGLFENPYVDPKTAEAVNDSKEHRALALRAAHEAIVLLKNNNNILPLKKDIHSVAVIGPCADSVLLGDYSGYGMKVVTLLEGVKGAVHSSIPVLYEKGCEAGFTSLPPIPPEFLFPADGKPGEQGLRGEYFDNQTLSGKPRLRRIDRQVHFTWAMGSPDSLIPREHFSVRWTGRLKPSSTGTYRFGASTDDGVRLWLDGKLLIDSWFDRGATLDAVTLQLEAGRSYDLRIEYYENDGWSYASLVWQQMLSSDPRIDAAAGAARRADVALVAVGIIEGEGYDRSHLDLPGDQEKLIKAVAATGTPTVVVLFAGSAVTMSNWIEDVAAIVDVWYPGEEGGTAIADVLWGTCNPGGKLPLTFPRYVGQLPLYYNHKPTGRGNDYSDMSGNPLFPFGYGLSYTTFKYTNLRLSSGQMSPGDTVRISVDIENTGSQSGDEVVQLYTRDSVASVTRPIKELQGFRRVTLAAGKKATVSFALSAGQLSFLDQSMTYVLEPGKIGVMVGSSSEDIRLFSSFEIRLK
jgi:beta-glucosidase